MLVLVLALPASGQPVPTQLDRVIVSGSGVERRAFETPYSITVINAQELRAAGPMVNLSESLVQVPGLVANLRNNYAQDLQISSRGFGARSTFGIRGLRLYTDGIPATMPDGQGQVSNFDIAGAQRIEVLRGPFSALYGANSGGVISLVSAPPTQGTYALDGDVGNNGLWQARAMIESPLSGGWNIRAQISEFNTGGVRPHSAAQRTLGNVRLGFASEADTLTLVLNSVDQPAQDPLGLTRAQFDADPYQTTAAATVFNTRKTSNQTQLGGTWRHRFADAGALQESVAMLYAGQRGVTQWQSIPIAPQLSPRHPGGVIEFDRNYSGIDARLIWRWQAASLIIGITSEQQGEDRRGDQNFSGNGDDRIVGVSGALRRDEGNRTRTNDLYAQGELAIAPTVSATLGLRSGRMQIRSNDRFLANGDDSDSRNFGYNTPVAAIQWLPSSALNVYLSAGKGFESPTLGELAYRPDGAAGFNASLQAQTSTQVELGAKWRDDTIGLAIDAALFRAETENEIGVQTNAEGRSTYRNVGSTRRSGAELGLRWQPRPAWRALVALTWLDATYRDGFQVCAATPCVRPEDRADVPAGNLIAGTMARSGFASLAWRAPDGTELAAELRYQGEMPVNDRNTDFSPSALLSALRLSRDFALGGGTLTLLARLDNLTGARYAGAIIVNEINGRYFETAAGRTALLALRWRKPF